MSNTLDPEVPQTFYLYRYQLHINEPFQPSLKLGKGCTTKKELSQKRQELFKEAINFIQSKSSKNTHRYQLVDTNEDETCFLLTAEADRRKRIVQNKKAQSVVHQPFAWIAINTDPNFQTIAVAQESDLRQEAVVTHLGQNLEIFLAERGLHISISPIFKQDSFWSFVNEHKHKLKEVSFVIHPPNMPALTKRIGEDVAKLAASLDAENANLSYKAKRSKPLQLRKSDRKLSGLVYYVQGGGGTFFFRLEGDSKKHILKKQQQSFRASISDGEDIFKMTDDNSDNAYILTKLPSQGKLE